MNAFQISRWPNDSDKKVTFFYEKIDFYVKKKLSCTAIKFLYQLKNHLTNGIEE